MGKNIHFPHLNIWTLVVLSHELDEAIHKLERIAAEYETDQSNIYIFKAALCQIRNCGFRLETALDRYIQPLKDE